MKFRFHRLAWVIFFAAGRLHADELAANSWSSVRAPLMTRWAKDVSPANALPEYPRPQFVRDEWLNLNGLWDYAIKPTNTEQPDHFDGKILVPYPVESALSGVMMNLDDKSVLWYRRTIKIPEAWRGQRVRLQFGAVDWECKIMVNGREVGHHRGGFDRFAFDITDSLHWNREEEIVIAVTDPTEGDQPRGKQSRNPEGIFYTANSGIWQTVWLEPVPAKCIDDLKIIPDVDKKILHLRVAVNSLSDDLTVKITASKDSKTIGAITGQANTELILPIEKPELWSPDYPILYDLNISLRQGEKELDKVSSYFAMRKVSLVSDEKGFVRIGLNNKPFFQLGALDQGFWPEGIYTAPTDEALRSDIEFLKQVGFNLVRKHVKVEPDRWYYWCDKLGIVVWQDMPSGNNATPEGQREFESELIHMINDLDNHPSIIVWILFNEGWGQHDTQRLTQRLKAIDPSRLVDSASGWTDAHSGDLIDIHNYPGPNAPGPEPRRASVLGEYGGFGVITKGHSWSPTRYWNYRMQSNSVAFAEAYAKALNQVWTLHYIQGLSAAVYTQVADVETECDGLLSYDREVTKISPGFLAHANMAASRLAWTEVVLPDALTGPAVWKYTFHTPSDEWFETNFPVADWKEGPAGFGTPHTPGAVIKTIWDTANIWMRREFILSNGIPKELKLEVHHDEDAEVYLNGVLAARLPGFIDHYDQFDISSEARMALHLGTNLIAVHCHQTTGGQYIDVGIVTPNSQKPPAPEPP